MWRSSRGCLRGRGWESLGTKLVSTKSLLPGRCSYSHFLLKDEWLLKGEGLRTSSQQGWCLRGAASHGDGILPGCAGITGCSSSSGSNGPDGVIEILT
jgi:hypothetical protein